MNNKKMMMNNEQLMTVAATVAREAGKFLAKEGQRLREIEFIDRSDVKLRADRESEALIRNTLSATTKLPVYGEEQGGDASLTQRYEPYWVVDPLDGTFNYLRGNPACAVSIGLMRGETPILGVIYDFNRDLLYHGIAGDVFRINDKPVVPAWAMDKHQAALITGFPSGMDTSEANLQRFVGTIAGYKKVRMIGSAALALAYVAEGVCDVYYEESIRLWDVAAGLALVQAAGGIIRMKAASDGKPMAYDISAGNPATL